MQNRPPLRAVLLDNLFWFAVALAMAIFLWVSATTQSDPIETWRLSERIPIRFTPDDGLIITNQSELTSAALVQLRAPRSVRQVMSADDVTVLANLNGLTPGEHVVQLEARIAPDRRATVISLSPSQVTITLEVQASQLKPVEAQIDVDPVPVVQVDDVRLDPVQVTVTGPAASVEQVVKAVIPLDLANARSTFETDIRPIPVDVDGEPVSGVNLSPAVVHVTVEISQRSDVRELRVLPDLIGQLPDGYVLAPTFNYEPTTIIVNGPADLLAALPDTVLTTPIDLSGRTDDFVIEVSAQLPDPRLLTLAGRTITVNVGVTAPTTTRQFDRVPVEIIGLRAGLRAELLPREVTVLVTGEQPRLTALGAGDLRVVVDLAAYAAAGTYRASPLAAAETDGALSVSVLPAEIDIQIVTALETTPETTPES